MTVTRRPGRDRPARRRSMAANGRCCRTSGRTPDACSSLPRAVARRALSKRQLRSRSSCSSIDAACAGTHVAMHSLKRCGASCLQRDTFLGCCLAFAESRACFCATPGRKLLRFPRACHFHVALPSKLDNDRYCSEKSIPGRRPGASPKSLALMRDSFARTFSEDADSACGVSDSKHLKRGIADEVYDSSDGRGGCRGDRSDAG